MGCIYRRQLSCLGKSRLIAVSGLACLFTGFSIFIWSILATVVVAAESVVSSPSGSNSGSGGLWRSLFQRGEESLRNGRLLDAEKSFQAAKSEAEKEQQDKTVLDSVNMALGQLFEKQAKYAAAESIYSELLSGSEKNNATAYNLELRFRLGNAQRHRGKFNEAQDNYLSVLKELTAGGAEYLQINTLQALAGMYSELGKYEEAEKLYRQALTLACGPETTHESKGQAKSCLEIKLGLAELFVTRSQYTEAETLVDEAAKECISDFGAQSVPYAQCLEMKGRVQMAQGQFKDSEQTLIKAVQLVESKYEAVAVHALGYLGDLYALQDKWKEAAGTFERIAKVEQRLYGGRSPALCASLSRQAGALAEMDDYVGAELCYKKVLEIHEQNLGKEHSDVAADFANLGFLFLRQGKYAEAESFYSRSLAMLEKSRGKSHPDYATGLGNLALLYLNSNQAVKAEGLLQEALAIRRRNFAPNHPAIIRSLVNLGSLYSETGKLPQSEQYLLEAVKLQEERIDFETPDYLQSKRQLAQLKTRADALGQAESIYREVLPISEKLYGEDSAQYAADLDVMAAILERENKVEEALQYKSKAEALKQKIPGRPNLLTDSTIEHNIGAEKLIAKQGNRAVKPFKDKWALVVGVSNFKDASINLRYAAKDATDFRNYLVNEAGFSQDHVKLLLDKDASRENIIANLGDRWLKRLANADDLVLIYISSHGSPSQKEAAGTNFIVPYEGSLDNIVLTGIPMQWLTAGIKDLVHCNRTLVVLDVCHGGAVSGAKSIRRGAPEVEVGPGQLILSSSRANQISWESKQYQNSVFTKRFIEGLRSRGKGTTLSQAFSFLKEKVEEEVLRDRAQLQTPSLSAKTWEHGDLIISAPAVAPRSLAPMPVAPGSVVPVSVGTGSVAPRSVAPVSVGKGAVGPRGGAPKSGGRRSP